MIGETIGNFKIVRLLGRGGMGEVYLAENVNIGTNAAIKVLRAEVSSDEEHVRRFFNEALAVSRIQHAGIVRIHDTGYTERGEAYLGMEYLAGETLAARIAARGPLPLDMLADFGKQIASVLGATHTAGITHRDLKPENIYIIRDQELPRGERVKILDFGIAKLTGTLAGASPQTIGTMGTPAYMAPEQWGDASKVDWRADVYSLGCVAYEMACGRPPFICTTIAEACAKHLHEVPQRVRSLMPSVPAALDELLARLLEKLPEARPQSMQEIARAFELIGEGRGSEIRAAAVAPTQGTMQAQVVASTLGGNQIGATMPPPQKSRKAMFAIIGVLAAGGAGAAAYFAVSGGDEHHKKKHDKITEATPVVADAQLAAPPPPVDAAQLAAPPPPVDAGKPAPPPVHHTIDLKAIDEVLLAKQADFDRCFAGIRSGTADVAPSVKLEFSIEPDGLAVQPVATLSTGAHNNCMTGIVDTLKFPNPTGTRAKVERQLALHEPPPRQFRNGELLVELNKRLAALETCGSKLGVHGRVMLDIAVGEDGAISDVAVIRHRNDPLEACMADIVKKIRLGKPPKPFSHKFPIMLP